MIQGKKKPALTPEQESKLRVFERGHRLAQLVNSPGWQDVLDILENFSANSEFQLTSFNPINAEGDVKDQVFWLHARARAMREAFDLLQKQIEIHIESAKTVAQQPAEEDFLGTGEDY